MKIKLFKYIPKEEIEHGDILYKSDIIVRRIKPEFLLPKLIRYQHDSLYWDENPYFSASNRRFGNLSEYERIYYRMELTYSWKLYKEREVETEEICDRDIIPRKIEDALYDNDLCQEEEVYLLTRYINPAIKEQFMKEIYPLFVEGETFIYLDIWN